MLLSRRLRSAFRASFIYRLRRSVPLKVLGCCCSSWGLGSCLGSWSRSSVAVGLPRDKSFAIHCTKYVARTAVRALCYALGTLHPCFIFACRLRLSHLQVTFAFCVCVLHLYFCIRSSHSRVTPAFCVCAFVLALSVSHFTFGPSRLHVVPVCRSHVALALRIAASHLHRSFLHSAFVMCIRMLHLHFAFARCMLEFRACASRLHCAPRALRLYSAFDLQLVRVAHRSFRCVVARRLRITRVVFRIHVLRSHLARCPRL